MVSTYTFAGISGAELNPAVSFSLALLRRWGSSRGRSWATAGLYAASQAAGGVLGALTCTVLKGDAPKLAPARGFNWLDAGVCELAYTFMLAFVFLNVRACSRPKNEFYGIAIGFVLVAGLYGAGQVSGGCFNPAVVLGVDIVSLKLGFGWCVLYTFFELAGAALAAWAFGRLRPGELEGTPRGSGMDSAKFGAEAIGTFLLVLTVGLNVLGKSPAGALAAGAALVSTVYALGDISGAHLNPAVTVGVVFAGRGGEDLPRLAGPYVAFQLLGGLAAAVVYVSVHHGYTVALGPRGYFGWVELAVVETTFTALLCFTVLAVTTKGVVSASNDMYGLAIGACVIAGGFAVGGISGGVLNPAVAVAAAAAHVLGGGLFWKAVVYTLFEVTGAAIAASLFKRTHAPEKVACGARPMSCGTSALRAEAQAAANAAQAFGAKESA